MAVRKPDQLYDRRGWGHGIHGILYHQCFRLLPRLPADEHKQCICSGCFPWTRHGWNRRFRRWRPKCGFRFGNRRIGPWCQPPSPDWSALVAGMAHGRCRIPPDPPWPLQQEKSESVRQRSMSGMTSAPRDPSGRENIKSAAIKSVPDRIQRSGFLVRPAGEHSKGRKQPTTSQRALPAMTMPTSSKGQEGSLTSPACFLHR